MNLFEILTMVLGAAMSVLGWFARQLFGDVKDLSKTISILKESLPKEYVLKDDFSKFRTELFDVLHRIENKLDGKVDK
mgnify:FL=1